MYLPTAKQYHQAPSITGNCSIINCNWFSTLWATNYSSLNPINYVRDVHVIMYDQNSLRGSNYRPNNKYLNYLKTVDVFIELSLNWDEMWSLLIITQNRSQNPSKVRKIQFDRIKNKLDILTIWFFVDEWFYSAHINQL